MYNIIPSEKLHADSFWQWLGVTNASSPVQNYVLSFSNECGLYDDIKYQYGR